MEGTFDLVEEIINYGIFVRFMTNHVTLLLQFNAFLTLLYLELEGTYMCIPNLLPT